MRRLVISMFATEEISMCQQEVMPLGRQLFRWSILLQHSVSYTKAVASQIGGIPMCLSESESLFNLV